MGVPAFYRWLSEKYGHIVKDVLEDEPQVVDGIEVPVDTSQPNPNGIEYDNLYLDMNGIIHPCFHPEDRAPPTTEAEVFLTMFDYIDRLFSIVRPRKLLVMAIDGVAPRAKMNQQRSRRFRAAQDAQEKEAEESRLRAEFEKQGIRLPEKSTEGAWDSNVITPGTPFMFRLSIALQYYIHLRLNSDPGWRNIMVILSDSNAPGEGEHKIMHMIRQERGREGWNPNTRHCLYGLDADLIMLSLASHEPHFSLLRENVTMPSHDNQPARPQLASKDDPNAEAPVEKPLIAKKPYQFLHVGLLREYLALEFDMQLPFERDQERIYDDFVFMCFFVGNDFLPHMPTLEIREGAIELLMATYKKELPFMGWLTNGAKVELGAVEHFITVIGNLEDQIFQKRAKLLQRQKTRVAADIVNSKRGREAMMAQGGPANQARPGGQWTASAPSRDYISSLQPAQGQAEPGTAGAVIVEPAVTSRHTRFDQDSPPPASDNKSAAAKLRAQLQAGSTPGGGAAEEPPAKRLRPSPEKDDANPLQNGTSGPMDESTDGVVDAGSAEMADQAMNEEEQDADETAAELAQSTAVVEASTADLHKYQHLMKEQMKGKADCFSTMMEDAEKIRLGEDGWKARYYQEKLGLPAELQQEVVSEMVKAYVEGLCWVLAYYYEGVASWNWFYPFHYAPFASDLKGFASTNIQFDLGEPFKPFNQLMGVLPAASAHCLPKPFQPLFTEEESPILDFFPPDFKVDMNGKRFAWQGVALLPFIDEDRLLAATGPLEDQLEPEEVYRNGRRLDLMYVAGHHPLTPELYQMAEGQANLSPNSRSQVKVKLDPELTQGFSGLVSPPQGEVCPAVVPAPFKLGEDITSNSVCCACLRMPEPEQEHRTILLPGTVLDEPKIRSSDLQAPRPLWHEPGGGGRGGGRGGRGGRGGYNPVDMGRGHHMANGHGWQGGGEGYGPHSNGPLAPGAFRMVQHGLGSPNMPSGPHANGFGRPPYQPQSQQAYGAGQFYPGMPGGQFQAPGGLNPHAPSFQPSGFPQQLGFGGVQQQQPQQQQGWGMQHSHRGGFSGPGRGRGRGYEGGRGGRGSQQGQWGAPAQPMQQFGGGPNGFSMPMQNGVYMGSIQSPGFAPNPSMQAPGFMPNPSMQGGMGGGFGQYPGSQPMGNGFMGNGMGMAPGGQFQQPAQHQTGNPYAPLQRHRDPRSHR